MKKLTLTESASLCRPNQRPVPSDRTLWEKINNLFKNDSNKKIIEVYEQAGGSWKILEFKSLQKDVVDTDIDEDVDLGPLSGHKDKAHAKRWLQRLKACDPDAYEKFLNWD